MSTTPMNYHTSLKVNLTWAAPCKNMSDQDLYCPLKVTMDITECMNVDQSPG